jgi:hypothetical protein
MGFSFVSLKKRKFITLADVIRKQSILTDHGLDDIKNFMCIRERGDYEVSKAEIETVRNFYNAAAATGRGGPVAPERAQYMTDILNRLKQEE